MLENQRRQEEREHEMQMLRMMMGYPPEAHTRVHTAHQQQQQQQPIRTATIFMPVRLMIPIFPTVKISPQAVSLDLVV